MFSGLGILPLQTQITPWFLYLAIALFVINPGFVYKIKSQLEKTFLLSVFYLPGIEL
ncbi:MAG: hypothetical protein MGU50_01720 [Trichodesmium sp. MAG_R02]|nr:hypothetical protein [Trichodesmium sp. MAG_R02]